MVFSFGGNPSTTLFVGPRLDMLLATRAQAMRKEVAKLPEEHALSVDDDAYAEAIAERFGVALPTLKRDELWREDHGEVDVDVRHNHSYVTRPGHTTVPGRRVALVLPFVGTADVFSHDPPGICGPKPRATVKDGALVHLVEYPGTSAPDLNSVARQFTANVQDYLNIGKEAVAEHNRLLIPATKKLLGERRERARAAQEALAKSGLPGPPTDKGKKPIADAIVRRPSPAGKASSSNGIELTAALRNETFEHIVEVLRMAGRGMEQSPGAYLSLNEEARRHHLRTTLNTHYIGKASAEAFNFNGKTDILVQVDGQALLVAECKFWTGAKGFTATIDQLFGYASWRDTKLAAVIFVEEKGLTDIIAKAAESLKGHSQHALSKPIGRETELRAEMKWPGDDARRVTLHCLFVHTPKP